MLHTVLSLLTGRFDVPMLACCTVRQSVAAASSGEGLLDFHPPSINLRVYYARSPFRSTRIVLPVSKAGLLIP